MDWNRVTEEWKQFKGKVKGNWGKLADDDLTAINHPIHQLERQTQKRHGCAKPQVRRDFAWDDWLP